MNVTNVLTENELSRVCLNAAFKVHKAIGPGLLESAYEQCFIYELRKSGLFVESQHPLPLIYEEVKLDTGYRADIVINQKILIEVKSVKALNDLHMAQVLTYLKLCNFKLGLLINFNVLLLKDGIKRVINGSL